LEIQENIGASRSADVPDVPGAASEAMPSKDADPGESRGGHSFKTDRCDIYRQLLDAQHVNIPRVLRIDEDAYGGAEVTIECVEGPTLRGRLESDVTEFEFTDYLLQLCDALEFLSKLKPPVVHNDVTADNILIGDGNMLKLVNFEHARNHDNHSGDISAVGRLIVLAGGAHAKRYGPVIRKCNRWYESFAALSGDIVGCHRPFIIRNAPKIAAVFMGMLMFSRLFSGLIRALF
jgi:serine/threonine protein kinase